MAFAECLRGWGEAGAYVVSYDNVYNGVKIMGDTYTTIVDDEGIKMSNFNWHKVVAVTPANAQKGTAIDLNKAQTIVQEKISGEMQLLSEQQKVNATRFQNVELMFVQAGNTNTYRPTWVFETEDSVLYNVDCISGALSVK